ncbi:unnamed protein product [Peniophora sp. CBMAI 1063]|nr:unnamed protein product [Peniophora sp. CBMAI 1063]
MSFDADVLVVGAGPVGLVGALALAMNGVKVRIVEKLPVPAIGQRGAGMQPRTMETYRALGIVDEVKATGIVVPNVQTYDFEGNPKEVVPMMDWGEKTPGVPKPEAWLIGQDWICKIVSRNLKERFGVEVEFGNELVSIDQDASGATATVRVDGVLKEIRVKYVIGTDGGKGITRKLAGANMVSKSDAEARSVIGELVLKGFNPDTENIHQFLDAKGNCLMIRPVHEDPGLFSIFGYDPDLDTARAAKDVDYLLQWIRAIMRHKDITIESVSSLAEWRLNVRICEKFQAGRILLAGDVAHLHSPTGGQGLTSGVMDVRNLSWKVALACKGLASPTLLDSYSEERVPVIAEMLKITTQFAEATFKANPDPDAFKRPAFLGQLGVHYRWSPIVYDGLRAGEAKFGSTNLAPSSTYGGGEGSRLEAGDRAPDAPGLVGPNGETALFDIFNVARHTVLIFSLAQAATVRAAVGRYPEGHIDVVVLLPRGVEQQEDYLVDSQGHAFQGYGVEAGVAVAIVRPDGVVGALLKAGESVDVYFSLIFAL